MGMDGIRWVRGPLRAIQTQRWPPLCDSVSAPNSLHPRITTQTLTTPKAQVQSSPSRSRQTQPADAQYPPSTRNSRSRAGDSPSAWLVEFSIQRQILGYVACLRCAGVWRPARRAHPPIRRSPVVLGDLCTRCAGFGCPRTCSTLAGKESDDSGVLELSR